MSQEHFIQVKKKISKNLLIKLETEDHTDSVPHHFGNQQCF